MPGTATNPLGGAAPQANNPRTRLRENDFDSPKSRMAFHPSLQLGFDVVVVRARIHENEIRCVRHVRLHVADAPEQVALYLHDRLNKVMIAKVTAQRQRSTGAGQTRAQEQNGLMGKHRISRAACEGCSSSRNNKRAGPSAINSGRRNSAALPTKS